MKDAGQDEAKEGDTPSKTKKALTKGQQAMQKLKQGQLGKEIVKKVNTLLVEKHDQVAPEFVVGKTKSLYKSKAARQVFATQVKDQALEFLLQYLPKAKVPPLSGVKDKTEWNLDKIDLGHTLQRDL